MTLFLENEVYKGRLYTPDPSVQCNWGMLISRPRARVLRPRANDLCVSYCLTPLSLLLFTREFPMTGSLYFGGRCTMSSWGTEIQIFISSQNISSHLPTELARHPQERSLSSSLDLLRFKITQRLQSQGTAQQWHWTAGDKCSNECPRRLRGHQWQPLGLPWEYRKLCLPPPDLCFSTLLRVREQLAMSSLPSVHPSFLL